MAYDYFGPAVRTVDLPLVCDGEWHELDLERFVAPAGEKTDAHVYLNIQSGYTVPTDDAKADLACPNCGSHFDATFQVPGVGRLRIKMRREPFSGDPKPDDTYFYDLPLQRGMSWLDSRALFEMAEKGRGQHWEYRVTNADGVVLSTRFVKESVSLGEVNL